MFHAFCKKEENCFSIFRRKQVVTSLQQKSVHICNSNKRTYIIPDSHSLFPHTICEGKAMWQARLQAEELLTRCFTNCSRKSFEREAKYRRAETIRYAALRIQKCQQAMCSSSEFWKKTPRLSGLIIYLLHRINSSKAELLSTAPESNWVCYWYLHVRPMEKLKRLWLTEMKGAQIHIDWWSLKAMGGDAFHTTLSK